jgi:tetratricopeptide (TPR) repeat protein
MHSILVLSWVWFAQCMYSQSSSPAKVETLDADAFVATVLDEPSWSYPWRATPIAIVQHCGDYLATHSTVDACRKSRILTVRARARMELGEYDKAMSDANEALSADPTNKRAYILAELLAFRVTRSPEKVAKHVEKDDKDARAHALLASFLSFSDAGKAIKVSDMALCLAGSDPEALAYCQTVATLCHIANKDSRKALASADLAIEKIQFVSWYFDPADLYSNRAGIHYRLGNVTEALADYQMALRLDPYHERSLAGVWSCHLRAGNYNASVLAANEYAKLFPPGSPEFVRAVSLSRVRKPAEAIRLIEKLPREGWGVPITIEYGIAHHIAGDYRAAKKVYESALKSSYCTALLTSFSILLSQTGDDAEKRQAMEFAERAAKDPEASVSAHVALMLAYAAVKDYRRAATAGKVALTLAKPNTKLSTAITTAIGHYDKGQPSEFDMIFLQSLDITTVPSSSLKQ